MSIKFIYLTSYIFNFVLHVPDLLMPSLIRELNVLGIISSILFVTQVFGKINL